jgi:hypothetical protein
MTNRLTRRRNLIIGGCIFAVLMLGVSCTGIVHAAGCDVSILASSDGLLLGGSEWSWTASDGGLAGVPPPAPGQEVIRGSYSGSLPVSGTGTVTVKRSLSSGETIGFSQDQQVISEGPGILEESLSVDSCRSSASGVSCGPVETGETGSNLTRSAYCEHVGTTAMFLADSLHYRSQGAISQGSLEVPDSFATDMAFSGHEDGAFILLAGSLTGIGTTDETGYIHQVREEIRAGGTMNIRETTRWSSFSSPS